MTIINHPNLHHMLNHAVNASPNTLAYRWFDKGNTQQQRTWREFYTEVSAVSKSLIALAIQKNDKVCILSNTSYHWALCDLGLVSIGAVTVGIYQSNLAKECEYIIKHSDAVLVFVENEEQLDKLLPIKHALPQVRKVILMHGKHNDNWVMPFEDFLALGTSVDEAHLQKMQTALNQEDIASIVYTSGTTGIPKGALLSHGNFIFVTQSVLACVDVRPGDSTLLFLPLAHVFARAILYAGLYANTLTYFNRNLENLLQDFKESRPHWFASVPRIYEKVYAKVQSTAEAKAGVTLKIFRWASAVGEQASLAREAKQALPFSLKVQQKIARKLVFGKVHAALGGRLRWCISGAAPMNPAIARFFDGAGIAILEGIGMTENTSFSNINRPNNYRIGTVGQAGPGIEIKIASDGEFLVRGPNVMAGYYKMPDETARTIDAQGWLQTGDLARIDDEGFVTITGRKKDLIITSGGKNIAPTTIESLLTLSKYIHQACVIGDKQKYLVALITLDKETVRDYCQAQGLAFDTLDRLAENPAVLALIKNEIALCNQQLASFESVKKFAIVPEFSLENGLLTPTLKIRRPLVLEKYAEKIAALYYE
ncbi:MAG TPA: long-chain fatty acid--CoA ligase [Pseudomonadales bacterium]|nr:long-chain fatty acid--CoA ligase [Pseudomonadales bacterium]